MAQAQYGIKVPLDGVYIWATQSAGFDDIKPLLFDSLAAATSAAEIWGPTAKVEQYLVDNA
jgi:hypothetical protein